MKQSEHTKQAEQNERFYGAIDRADFSDWAGTVLFYAAVHRVDAWLDKFKSRHPSDHAERRREIEQDAFLQRIDFAYRALRDLGWNTRYRGYRPSAKDLADCEQRLATITSALK